MLGSSNIAGVTGYFYSSCNKFPKVMELIPQLLGKIKTIYRYLLFLWSYQKIIVTNYIQYLSIFDRCWKWIPDIYKLFLFYLKFVESIP